MVLDLDNYPPISSTMLQQTTKYLEFGMHAYKNVFVELSHELVMTKIKSFTYNSWDNIVGCHMKEMKMN